MLSSSLVNLTVILGSQRPFSFNFYFIVVFLSIRVYKVVVVVVLFKDILKIIIGRK